MLKSFKIPNEGRKWTEMNERDSAWFHQPAALEISILNLSRNYSSQRLIMDQDTEYQKLPLEERCVHKLWKARLHGYEECIKTFQCIDNEKSAEWKKYLGIIRKFVVDSNAAAQEKGLEAALAFLENAAIATKTVGEVMNGIVTKCMATPKAKTKDLAVKVTLMCIEIEKQDIVLDELLKGTEAKNPKVVAVCISTLTLSLREFGPVVINVKPLIKKLPAFLEHRDKSVREEAKSMAVEIYRWVGVALQAQLNTLKPVQIAELETEFNNLQTEKAVPLRFLKSQQQKMVYAADTTDNREDNTSGDVEYRIPVIDPYDLLEPVDILSKLPKDFFEKIEAKKWQERKEALEALETLSKNPKLENGDYGDLMRALKKIISKDSNIMVVTLAAKCLSGLATGLKKRFQPYANVCLSSILEKFREKKQSVVQALREAADAIFLCITIDSILEETLAALENKNPAVKAETAAYLVRCFARTPPPSLNKKLLKAYTNALLKTLNEPDSNVRDNSAEALGTAMKLVGEKAIVKFLADIDNLKMTKIKEYADKATILTQGSSVQKTAEKPNTALAKPVSTSELPQTKPSGTKKPNAAVSNKRAGSKKAVAAPSASSGTKKLPGPKSQPEKNLSNEEVDEIAAQSLPSEVVSGLVDSNWKTRLSAAEKILESVKQMELANTSTQVVVRILARKPGFKDTNFQVLKLKLEIVKLLAENYPFSSTVAEYCMTDVTEKLTDTKNNAIACETLTAIAEAISLEYVADEIIVFALNQKNPKVQQEALSWLSKAITEFGLVVNIKNLLDNIKKALAMTNPSIRTAGITLLGTLYLFMGKQLLMFFENEKPALKQQIERECEKHNGETPPVPIRGAKTKKKNVDNDTVEPESEKNNIGGEINLSNLLPRVDISGQITEELLNELSHKDWKVRNESLQKIGCIVNEAKLIKGSLGDLPRGLAPRLLDSNSKIAQSTLIICEALATAVGPPIKQHVRLLFPGFMHCLGDSKNWMRTTALSCINTWGEQCGYKEFFDGEMIGDALKGGSPTFRIELWSLLAQKLPSITVKHVPKEELLVCLPYLYSNLEDRNSDVRKNAQEAVVGFMTHLSYESMVRNMEKLKPGSKKVVLAALDNARSNVVMKPLPKQAPVEESSSKIAKPTSSKANKGTVKNKKTTVAKPAAGKQKDEDVDVKPLMVINNLKNQRVIDEQRLKILKWNFTVPREEFVDLLKELMITANISKILITNMFHSDFRYHLKAIESLTEDLPHNLKALVANLDLILKWMTLRFFDTNPSVLLKGLDYLQLVFNLLIEDEYHMLDVEANSFIPYLIIKIGDPKDAVRNAVRGLLKQIALIYPLSKLFSYVMVGLKSKNARQRSECLDQLGLLIKSYGVSVCQPSPSVALKEIAEQIADRDNSVRNAALNCIAEAYFMQGERVLKLIGRISEKDLSLLNERIKRAAKNRTAKTPTINVPSTSVSPVPPSEDPCPAETEDTDDNTVCESPEKPRLSTSPAQRTIEETNEALDKHPDATKTVPPTITQIKVSGPFELDMTYLREIEAAAPAKFSDPVLANTSFSDEDEPVNTLLVPNIESIEISPPRMYIPKPALPAPLSSVAMDCSLERNIVGIASTELPVAIQAMRSITNLLESHQVSSFHNKEDRLIGSINMQLKFLQIYIPHQLSSDVHTAFDKIFSIIHMFYDSAVLGKNVPMIHLKTLLNEMISLLAKNKVEHFQQANMFYRVVNNAIIKTIENSNYTNAMRASIQLLRESIGDEICKYEEIVMKILWKLIKSFPNRAEDLDYDAVLLETHYFFTSYPTAWWKKRSSDTSLRTVRTILFNMIKSKGSDILNHLNNINNGNESELRRHIMKLITHCSGTK
ncbi:hypothetical protein KM043_006629 [Ampulex compressa]|nr:hypothetical protein KM043_006629 [Ampulex compressa]